VRVEEGRGRQNVVPLEGQQKGVVALRWHWRIVSREEGLGVGEVHLGLVELFIAICYETYGYGSVCSWKAETGFKRRGISS
jgi:hypothetical protein